MISAKAKWSNHHLPRGVVGIVHTLIITVASVAVAVVLAAITIASIVLRRCVAQWRAEMLAAIEYGHIADEVEGYLWSRDGVD